MATPLIIFGAGGSGRDLLEIVRALQRTGADLDFLGFIDDTEPDAARLARVGTRWLGDSTALGDLPRGTAYVIGIGDGRTRQAVAPRLIAAQLTPLTLVHPAATIGDDVQLGAGTIVAAGVRITTNVRVGAQVHLYANVTVGHDAVLGDYASVYPLAAISGDVTLGPAATVGSTACVNQGLTVGENAYVASGAAVIRNVGAAVLVAGVPAVAKKQAPPSHHLTPVRH